MMIGDANAQSDRPALEWPPEFTLDRERILNLLTGDRFYSDASAALREAVLNAIDAISRRRHGDQSALRRIEVLFDSASLTLTVSDTGDGMGQKEITSLFTRVGASAAALGTGGTPVGEFGIGVVSYFMAGDTFSIQTYDGKSKAIGLRFNKQMLAGARAEKVPETRSEQGTTVEIHLRDRQVFDLLKEKLPYWCRDVEGLFARLEPDGTVLNQGGVRRPESVDGIEIPEWIESAHLAPVSGPTGWESMSGQSVVSVLYRGVFVQDLTVNNLWGIEGSIDVDPKKFRPRLNRESFVDAGFQQEVQVFLQTIHPRILAAMANRVSIALRNGELNKWATRRWAAIWMSVPRAERYAEAARIWDDVFRKQPAFELMVGQKWEEVSVEHLIKLDPPVYVAPLSDQGGPRGEAISAALRLLRGRGKPVIRGLAQDRAWAKLAGSVFQTTADLIASVFATDLPRLMLLADSADDVLDDVQPLATVYDGPPSVDLVRFGPESAPVIRLPRRLVINIDNEAGKLITSDVIEQNTGPWSLVSITARRSHEHVSTVVASVREFAQAEILLGLVRRRFLRGLLS
jgi:hypothetical protein